jgi:hypothetical protein
MRIVCFEKRMKGLYTPITVSYIFSEIFVYALWEKKNLGDDDWGLDQCLSCMLSTCATQLQP